MKVVALVDMVMSAFPLRTVAIGNLGLIDFRDVHKQLRQKFQTLRIAVDRNGFAAAPAKRKQNEISWVSGNVTDIATFNPAN